MGLLMYGSLCLVLLMTGITAKEWTSSEYPDPQVDPIACGRESGTPSYVCDPDNIISKKSADALDHILLNFSNDTRCPCSTWYCERDGNNKGYIMAIALVDKLKRPDNVPNTVEGRKGLAREFAFDLLRKHWRYGRCEEATVLVFSKQDGILMTYADLSAQRVLTDVATLEIQRQLSRFFRDGANVGQGLHYIVMNYRRVLDGYHYTPVQYSDVPSAAAIIPVSILTSLVSTVLLKMFC